jgi:hypothetical protein
MQTVHDGVGSVTNILNQREGPLKSIMTPEQRIKFLSWAANNAGRIGARFEEKRRRFAGTLYHTPSDDSQSMDICSTKTGFRLMKESHIACNLYILNHRLQDSVVQKFPYQGLEVTAAALKRLSRRASFESLGQQKDAEGKLLKRDDSFASSGSLSMMNSASTPSLVGMDEQSSAHHQQHTPQLSPEEAEKTASCTIERILGPIVGIIPPFPAAVATHEYVVSASMSEAQPQPVYSSSQIIDHYHHGYGVEDLEVDQYPAPTPVLSLSSGSMPQVASAPLLTTPSAHVSQPHYQTAASPVPVLTTPSAHVGQLHYQTTSGSAPLHTQGTMLLAQPSHITYAHQYQQPQSGKQYIQQPQGHAQIVYTATPMVVVQAPPGAPLAPRPAPLAHSATTSNHVRNSSFLPSHLNAVPEDMFPTTGDTSEDDFFIGLMEDDDWAIGGGMDLSTD